MTVSFISPLEFLIEFLSGGKGRRREREEEGEGEGEKERRRGGEKEHVQTGAGAVVSAASFQSTLVGSKVRTPKCYVNASLRLRCDLELETASL